MRENHYAIIARLKSSYVSNYKISITLREFICLESGHKPLNQVQRYKKYSVVENYYLKKTLPVKDFSIAIARCVFVRHSHGFIPTKNTFARGFPSTRYFQDVSAL